MGSLLELFEDDGMLLAKINASQWEDYSQVTLSPNILSLRESWRAWFSKQEAH